MEQVTLKPDMSRSLQSPVLSVISRGTTQQNFIGTNIYPR
jgi:hypothetical protein